MRTFVIELLKAMEAAVPPPPNCHHSLAYARSGSDEAGWTDKLALWVNNGEKFQSYFIGPEDEGKSPEAIVSEIVALMRCAATVTKMRYPEFWR